MKSPNIGKMNGKRQGNKLDVVISTGMGEKKENAVSKPFCLKATADFSSPRTSCLDALLPHTTGE